MIEAQKQELDLSRIPNFSNLDPAYANQPIRPSPAVNMAETAKIRTLPAARLSMCWV